MRGALEETKSVEACNSRASVISKLIHFIKLNLVLLILINREVNISQINN